MESIYSYIRKNAEGWVPEFDSHTQLWSISDTVDTAKRRVRMPFNPLKYNIDTAELSFRRLNSIKDRKREDLICGTGNTTTQLRRVVNDERFDGIGEVIINKRFITFDDGKRHERTVWRPELLEELLDEKRPIYLHFDLTDNQDMNGNLEKFMQLHDGPVVLCHCGLNRLSNLSYKEAFDKFMSLQSDYNNLWGEISWDCMDWIMSEGENARRGPVIAERMIAGTDLTPYDSVLDERKRAWQLAYLDKLSGGKLSRNTAELFGI